MLSPARLRPHYLTIGRRSGGGLTSSADTKFRPFGGDIAGALGAGYVLSWGMRYAPRSLLLQLLQTSSALRDFAQTARANGNRKGRRDQRRLCCSLFRHARRRGKKKQLKDVGHAPESIAMRRAVYYNLQPSHSIYKVAQRVEQSESLLLLGIIHHAIFNVVNVLHLGVAW